MAAHVTRVFPLPQVPPMTQEDGHLPLEPWVQERLTSQFNYEEKKGGLEYSRYGVLNTLLHSQFPATRKFMIKPQGALQAMNRLAFAPQQPNTSGGTTSSAVPILADFIVVRAAEMLFHDWTLCIVEVKRNDQSHYQAIDQLQKYMERVANEYRVVGTITGFLVAGGEAYIIEYEPNSELPHLSSGTLIGRADGLEFKLALFRVARRYWGNENDDWRSHLYTGEY